MTSEYMNNLYRDLLSNSPQTVTIPIPSDMGTGQIAQVVTKQGAVVSDWKMNYFSDMNVRGINSEDYIQMLFCLNDGVSWNIAGSREGACLAKGESCIYRGHGKMESLCYAQNSDFYFKNIKIPVPYFKRLNEARFSNIFIENRASTCPQSLEKSRLFSYALLVSECENFQNMKRIFLRKVVI